MKLTLNRREEKSGLVFKKPVYILDVNLEFTDEELQLIRKHKWHERLNVGADSEIKEIKEKEYRQTIHTSNMKNSHRFVFVENLLWFEKKLIEEAKLLKNNLENVVGVTSGGPSEVEL